LSKLLIGLSGADETKELPLVAQILILFGYTHFDYYEPINSAISGLMGIPVDKMIAASDRGCYVPGTDTSINEAVDLFSAWCNNALSDELLPSLLLKKVDPELREEKPVVVSNVRTAEDAAYIRSLGGEIWQVGSNDTIRADRLFSVNGNFDLLMPILMAISKSDNEAFLLGLRSFITDIAENITTKEIDRLSREILPNVSSFYAKRVGRISAVLLVMEEIDIEVPALSNNDFNAIIYSDRALLEMSTVDYLTETMKNILLIKMYLTSMGGDAINELREWWENHHQSRFNGDSQSNQRKLMVAV
jgi:hypothetical protein